MRFIIVDLAAIITTILISAAGWVIGFITAIRAAERAARHQERFRVLSEAWLDLERCSNRTGATAPDPLVLERALAAVQLYGSGRVKLLAFVFIKTFAASGNGDLLDLLSELRRDLAGVRETDRDLWHLRIRTEDETPRALHLPQSDKHRDAERGP